MKIPFYASRLKIRRGPVRFIIIHETLCQYDLPEIKVDNPSYQLQKITNRVIEKKEVDINFHYVVEKIKDDYEVLASRPLVALCDFDDIPRSVNLHSIHIAAMGSYDLKVPEERLYEVMAYRLLNPILKNFSLHEDRVKLHKEVSQENKNCPGFFFDKNIVISMIRRFIIK